MKNPCFLIPLLLLLAFPLPGQGQAEKTTHAVYEAYIRKYAPIAVKHMREYGIPASITLAQGLLESGAGTSDLARTANNHFGIKCHKDWSGDTFYKDDDTKNECFRKYKNPEESFRDHALFLTTRQRYADLFKLDKTDYKGWAKGLKSAGYATNPAYAEKLIGLIETYELYHYDSAKRQRWWERLFKKGKPAAPDPPASVKTAFGTVHKVNGAEYLIANPGETLQSLADSLAVNVWTLRKYNDLGKEQDIRPGDRVFIQSKRKKGAVETHTVLPGETLHSISQLYGIRLKSLIRLNHSDPGAVPEPGTVLHLR
ncbi:MAG TPA: glucosaminidase domain-containing protein [Bacteroidales bacterium]|nr:glucosaminidase domain-containing protein [Bacteroidales bacterium]HRZ48563.1 glucosaminidase domain-containing protein [Bacteroidales bacterium]